MLYYTFEETVGAPERLLSPGWPRCSAAAPAVHWAAAACLSRLPCNPVQAGFHPATSGLTCLPCVHPIPVQAGASKEARERMAQHQEFFEFNQASFMSVAGLNSISCHT